MAPVLGRIRVVGLGKETTPGTKVAPTHWQPHQENTVEDQVSRIFDESGLGTRYKAFAGDTNMESAGGNINGLVYDRTFGHFLLAAMGGVVTTAHPTATGAKNHAFAVANTLPSYTIATKDDNESWRFGYGMLNTLEISVDQDSHATFNSSWLARKGATAANTPSFLAENRFRPQDVTVKIANDVASLGAAPVLRVKNLSLSINNNLITEPSLGTVDPEYYPGAVETSISLGRLYLDTTIKDFVFGTTKKALQIAFTRSDVTIGTGSPTNPAVVFTFEPGFFSEWNREGGLDDLKQENFTYQPIFSTSAGKQFAVVATNMETAY